jgi:hypothetical protein
MNQSYRGYKGNPNLKQLGEEIQFTRHQALEVAKCSKDPIYFLEKYGKIVAIGKGVVPFKLFSYQKRFVKAITENRKVIGKIGRQMGKCVSPETEITIRNKTTGEIMTISIEEFYNMVNKENDNDQMS